MSHVSCDNGMTINNLCYGLDSGVTYYTGEPLADIIKTFINTKLDPIGTIPPTIYGDIDELLNKQTSQINAVVNIESILGSYIQSLIKFIEAVESKVAEELQRIEIDLGANGGNAAGASMNSTMNLSSFMDESQNSSMNTSANSNQSIIDRRDTLNRALEYTRQCRQYLRAIYQYDDIYKRTLPPSEINNKWPDTLHVYLSDKFRYVSPIVPGDRLGYLFIRYEVARYNDEAVIREIVNRYTSIKNIVNHLTMLTRDVTTAFYTITQDLNLTSIVGRKQNAINVGSGNIGAISPFKMASGRLQTPARRGGRVPLPSAFNVASSISPSQNTLNVTAVNIRQVNKIDPEIAKLKRDLDSIALSVFIPEIDAFVRDFESRIAFLISVKGMMYAYSNNNILRNTSIKDFYNKTKIYLKRFYKGMACVVFDRYCLSNVPLSR